MQLLEKPCLLPFSRGKWKTTMTENPEEIQLSRTVKLNFKAQLKRVNLPPNNDQNYLKMGSHVRANLVQHEKHGKSRNAKKSGVGHCIQSYFGLTTTLWH